MQRNRKGKEKEKGREKEKEQSSPTLLMFSKQVATCNFLKGQSSS